MSSCKIKYSVDETEAETERDGKLAVPRTANGQFGWPPPGKYLEWEKSTYFISPKAIALTPKVTQHPFSSIILG